MPLQVQAMSQTQLFIYFFVQLARHKAFCLIAKLTHSFVHTLLI